jgi:hypothetical protein
VQLDPFKGATRNKVKPVTHYDKVERRTVVLTWGDICYQYGTGRGTVTFPEFFTLMPLIGGK